MAAPREIVPPLVTDRSGLAIVDALFDGLTRIEDGTPVPAAAERWWSNADGTVWTFILRPGAVFHDGTPVTAQDVRFSWEEGIRRGRLPPYLDSVRGYGDMRSGRASALEGVIVRGSRTLHVFLDEPRTDFASVVAHPSLAPVAMAAWGEDEGAYRAQPIGNGPFRIAEEWAGGSFVRANRSETWANGQAASLDEVLFRFTDPATGFVAFQQGRVDIAEIPAGGVQAALERFGEADGVERATGVVRDVLGEVYLLAMNVREPPFDDPSVRRALSFALDRQAIVDRIPDAQATPARSLTPTTIPDAPVSTCTTCVYAPNAAARVFEREGIDRLELWVSTEGGHEVVAEEMAAALADVGVTLDVRAVPFGDFVAAVESGQARLFRYGWAVEHPTLDDVLVPLLHSRSEGLASGNPGAYTNPDVDVLLDTARATKDRAERAALFQQAEALAVGRDQAVVPVMFTRQRLVVADHVEGWAMGPTGRVDLTGVGVGERDP